MGVMLKTRFILLFITIAFITIRRSTAADSTTKSAKLYKSVNNISNLTPLRASEESIGNVGWSQWSDWSDCSRSCGAGIQERKRTCVYHNNELEMTNKNRVIKHRNREAPHRRHKCQLNSEELNFRVCQREPCAEESDWQRSHCSRYNSQSFNDQLYDWHAFADDHTLYSACKLICRPKVGDRYLDISIAAVVDNGMPCGEGQSRVCLGGTCESVGCDGIISSGLRYDSCGVCGGDNKTCETISGHFSRRALKRGWNLISRLPLGSYNISVSQENVTENKLGLRDSNGRFIIDGRKSSNGLHRGASTLFNYHSSFLYGDKITSIEKSTDQELFLLLYSYQPNVGVTYRYLVRVSDPWSEQTTQFTTVRYNRKYNNTTIFDDKAIKYRKAENRDLQLSDEQNMADQIKKQDFQWQASDWNQCSVTCGTGFRTRNVNCVLVDPASDTKQPALDIHCPQPMPITVQNCQITENCDLKHKWRVISDWTPCSVTCDKGVRKRTVCCFQVTTFGDDVQVPDRHCDPKERPPCEEQCNAGPCPTWQWLVSPWSNRCSNECGYGIERRTVICYGGGQCDPSTKPIEERKCCSSRGCSQAKWFYTDWSKCSSNCGNGVERRDLVCMRLIKARWHLVSDDECKNMTRPETERSCVGQLCVAEWFVSEWATECVNDLQTRTVLCLDSRQQLTETCARHDSPASSRSCEVCADGWHGSHTYGGRTAGADNNGRDNNLSLMDSSTASHTASPAQSTCRDQLPNCYLAPDAKLCTYEYYRKICCKSCADKA